MHAVTVDFGALPTPPFLLAIAAARLDGERITVEAEELVVRLFHAEGRSLVRLARLFVDDRDAAEDIVQEAFLRLARHAGKIDAVDRAPAYLRSIVLNLARDQNRRGLVSLRHHAASGREVDVVDDTADRLVRSEEHRRVLDAVRRLPARQRDCIALRYFEELPIDGIAATLGLSANSVKTHLQRAMAALDRELYGAMNGVALERRLEEAFADARTTVEEHPDLFARVTRSLEDARARRRFRRRLALMLLAFIAANAALALALSDYDNGRFTMPWWVIELITNIVLAALAVGLGPFIKRFGRSYAADVFRANPRTGKSYLVLTDVAYYLIFTSFVLFTITFVEPSDWKESTGAQLKHEVARVGGILLIMGILHAANVVALPVIGRLLASNKRFDDARSGHAERGAAPAAVPPLGPGTWVLRIEAAPENSSPHPDPEV